MRRLFVVMLLMVPLWMLWTDAGGWAAPAQRSQVRKLENKVQSLERSLSRQKARVVELEEAREEGGDDSSGLENNEWGITALVVGVLIAVLRAIWYGATATVVAMSDEGG